MTITPASLNQADLHDFTEELRAVAEADLAQKLELLQTIHTEMDRVLHGE